MQRRKCLVVNTKRFHLLCIPLKRDLDVYDSSPVSALYDNTSNTHAHTETEIRRKILRALHFIKDDAYYQCTPGTHIKVCNTIKTILNVLKRIHIHCYNVTLPDCLRDPAVDSEQFRWDLKTYLFAGHLRRQRIRGVT